MYEIVKRGNQKVVKGKWIVIEKNEGWTQIRLDGGQKWSTTGICKERLVARGFEEGDGEMEAKGEPTCSGEL